MFSFSSLFLFEFSGHLKKKSYNCPKTELVALKIHSRRALFLDSLSLAFHSTAEKDIKKTRQLTAHLATAFSLMDVIVKERGSGIGNPEQRGAPRHPRIPCSISVHTKERSVPQWVGERGGSFHLLYVYITGNAPIMEARVDESISVSSVGWKLIYRLVGEKTYTCMWAQQKALILSV